MRDSHHPATIKTSPPSLEGVIERHRLIDALARLPAPAKWLQAPSGTGKSTLAASYARSRGKPLVWYRLDDRDNDPAFFYTQFAQAVRSQLRQTGQLPKFSSDDHDRKLDFAHRFVTALSEQLSRPTLIVLDEIQRIETESMQTTLASLVAVAPTGTELLFVSQSAAPSAFFDAIAARELALLNDADLRFDIDECKAMSAALRVDEGQSESLVALTGGHAGALVLACELLRGTDSKSPVGIETAERIHSHLLAKLIDRMPEPRRELLLRTAFVTQLTQPIAEALAGVEAANEFEALVESGLLRQAGLGTAQVFEAHGLVRHGVRALVAARLGRCEAHALAERTATTLIENNQAEEAFNLLVEISSNARAIGVLEGLAESYAAQGHTDLLMNSIAKVTEGEASAKAWLCFWTGQALLRVDEEHARVWLGRSYAAFESDLLGRRLTAASVVTAFGLETGDIRELDTWIERHRDAGGDQPAPIDRFEASLIMGIICTAVVRGHYPQTIDSETLTHRLQLLLESEHGWQSADQRVQGARLLIEHMMIFGDHAKASGVITATRRLIDNRTGGALHRGRWLIAAAYAHFSHGDLVQALPCLNEAQLLSEQSGSTRLSFEIGFAFSDYWMKCSDLPRAADQLRRLETVAAKGAPAQRAQYARMMSRLFLLQENFPEGLRWAQEAKRMALPAGYSGASLRTFDFDLVYALAANKKFGEAIELVSQHEFDPPQIRNAVEHCLRFLLDGDHSALRTGLQAAAQISFVNLFDRARTALAKICEAALANDIEADFVMRLIAAKKLKPPPLAGARWPWPVRVRTLGGFRLEIRGERYLPTHKAQDKPLELLKLLVTCQAVGRESADKTWIAERLWPDADEVNARKSLDMTVGRLRRLLACEDAVLVKEGRVQLSDSHVWTDIKTLREGISYLRSRRDEKASGNPSSVGEAARSILEVLHQYGGRYLSNEDEPPWLLAGREAIAAAVRHALITADAILDGSADGRLVPALESALIADPTSEDLARSLMHAHLRQGQSNEAVRVYRRLREMLSLLLGVAPSAETTHIYDDARSQLAPQVDEPAK